MSKRPRQGKTKHVSLTGEAAQTTASPKTPAKTMDFRMGKRPVQTKAKTMTTGPPKLKTAQMTMRAVQTAQMTNAQETLVANNNALWISPSAASLPLGTTTGCTEVPSLPICSSSRTMTADRLAPLALIALLLFRSLGRKKCSFSGPREPSRRHSNSVTRKAPSG